MGQLVVFSYIVVTMGANILILCLGQAWDLYYHVFRRIDKQLQSLTTLDLEVRRISFHMRFFFPIIIALNLFFFFFFRTNTIKSVSPELIECRNLELAVPGTYRAGKFKH